MTGHSKKLPRSAPEKKSKYASIPGARRITELVSGDLIVECCIELPRLAEDWFSLRLSHSEYTCIPIRRDSMLPDVMVEHLFGTEAVSSAFALAVDNSLGVCWLLEFTLDGTVVLHGCGGVAVTKEALGDVLKHMGTRNAVALTLTPRGWRQIWEGITGLSSVRECLSIHILLPGNTMVFPTRDDG